MESVSVSCGDVVLGDIASGTIDEVKRDVAPDIVIGNVGGDVSSGTTCLVVAFSDVTTGATDVGVRPVVTNVTLEQLDGCTHWFTFIVKSKQSLNTEICIMLRTRSYGWTRFYYVGLICVNHLE